MVMGPSRVAAEAPGMFKTKMHKDLPWTKLGTQCHLLAIREKIWEICYRRETGSSQPPGGGANFGGPPQEGTGLGPWSFSLPRAHSDLLGRLREKRW